MSGKLKYVNMQMNQLWCRNTQANQRKRSEALVAKNKTSNTTPQHYQTQAMINSNANLVISHKNVKNAKEALRNKSEFHIQFLSHIMRKSQISRIQESFKRAQKKEVRNAKEISKILKTSQILNLR